MQVCGWGAGPRTHHAHPLLSTRSPRFNVGQVTLNLEGCKCNNFPTSEGTLTESDMGDGTLAVEWSI
jgi:hypothetical protein